MKKWKPTTVIHCIHADDCVFAALFAFSVLGEWSVWVQGSCSLCVRPANLALCTSQSLPTKMQRKSVRSFVCEKIVKVSSTCGACFVGNLGYDLFGFRTDLETRRLSLHVHQKQMSTWMRKCASVSLLIFFDCFFG